MIDYEVIYQNVRKVLDKRDGYSLRMNNVTFKELEKYSYELDDQNPRAVAYIYGSPVYIDGSMKDGVVDIWN